MMVDFLSLLRMYFFYHKNNIQYLITKKMFRRVCLDCRVLDSVWFVWIGAENSLFDGTNVVEPEENLGACYIEA